MLQRAIDYEYQLSKLISKCIDKEEYKFFSSNSSPLTIQIDKSTEERQQFVSISNNGQVIGFFEALLNIKGHYVSNISIIKFNDDKAITFSKDLFLFLTKLFLYYKYEKISYCCVSGSPQEKLYDKYTEKYGGRIVGIQKQHFVSESRDKFDIKLYEIMLSDFLTQYKNVKLYQTLMKKNNKEEKNEESFWSKR